MKVCYRKSDGLYCDTEGSWPFRYPGDEEFVKGPNVIERFGGEVEDYVVAELVRMIFGIYLQEESLIRTVAEVDKRGIRTKSWTSKKGNEHGGRPLDKSALHRLLSNVAYSVPGVRPRLP